MHKIRQLPTLQSLWGKPSPLKKGLLLGNGATLTMLLKGTLSADIFFESNLLVRRLFAQPNLRRELRAESS